MNGTVRIQPPQAFISSYAPRIRTYGNALLAPVVPAAPQLPTGRAAGRRGAAAINYAEIDGYDEDDFDDDEGKRRPTGLRSLRRDAETGASTPVAQPQVLGKEADKPVAVQGIWRDWMGKQGRLVTEKQIHIQNALPLNLIPIRIDVEIPSFRPEAPLPTPSNAREYGIDETLPAYKQPEPTPAFRLHDSFLWNLHEALLTPDQFAKKFVEELDFPYDRRFGLIQQISSQIRQQLEEYAGIAMHPLFHTVAPSVAPKAQPQADGTIDPQAQNSIPVTTAPSSERATPMPQAATILNHNTAIPLATGQEPIVTATASPGRLLRDQFPAGTHVANNSSYTDAIDILNPSEAYRCIVSLSISHLSSLYTDKFEWSLLHPPGHAEHFAAITSADLGLSGEWTSAIAHAIYEAVLRLKKEVCENGGALLAAGLAGGELPNESVPLGMGAAARQAGDVDDTEIFDIAAGVEAGFRWDPEALGIEWEPRVEELSKEDIEKREGDRERQLRRVRRETARFSSTTNTNTFTSGRGGIDSFRHDEPAEEERMGRGERSKKKRRFRSMSPGRDTPDAGHAQGGYGGGVALTDAERVSWRCSHCQVWGAAVWAVRDGPGGAKTLCHNCGFLYERDKQLPPWSKDYFAYEIYQGAPPPLRRQQV